MQKFTSKSSNTIEIDEEDLIQNQDTDTMNSSSNQEWMRSHIFPATTTEPARPRPTIDAQGNIIFSEQREVVSNVLKEFTENSSVEDLGISLLERFVNWQEPRSFDDFREKVCEQDKIVKTPLPMKSRKIKENSESRVVEMDSDDEKDDSFYIGSREVNTEEVITVRPNLYEGLTNSINNHNLELVNRNNELNALQKQCEELLKSNKLNKEALEASIKEFEEKIKEKNQQIEKLNSELEILKKKLEESIKESAIAVSNSDNASLSNITNNIYNRLSNFFSMFGFTRIAGMFGIVLVGAFSIYWLRHGGNPFALIRDITSYIFNWMRSSALPPTTTLTPNAPLIETITTNNTEVLQSTPNIVASTNSTLSITIDINPGNLQLVVHEPATMSAITETITTNNGVSDHWNDIWDNPDCSSGGSLGE